MGHSEDGSQGLYPLPQLYAIIALKDFLDFFPTSGSIFALSLLPLNGIF